MIEKSSKTFVPDLLRKTIRPDLTVLSIEDIGHKLANFINQKCNEATAELWMAILIIFEEAIVDATQIDSYVHIFHYFFTHLSNQIQNKTWASAGPDKFPKGRNLAIEILSIKLREGVDNFRLYLPREFHHIPSNKVFSTNDDMRQVSAINVARSKYINVNSLIGRLWALDVVDASGLIKMLLDNFCEVNGEPGNNELGESELNIESACALIRATNGKLELSVGKPRFAEYLKFLEKKLWLPSSNSFLKVKITETLRPYN